MVRIQLFSQLKIDRNKILTSTLPNSIRPSKLQRVRFYKTLASKLERVGYSRTLVPFLRSLLTTRKPIYRQSYFIRRDFWYSLVQAEVLRLFFLRRRAKSAATRARLKLYPGIESRFVKIPMRSVSAYSSKPRARVVWSKFPTSSISITKGYSWSYMESVYLGVKDSLSRYVLEWIERATNHTERALPVSHSYLTFPQSSGLFFQRWVTTWVSLINIYSSFSLLPQLDLYTRIHSAQRKVIEHVLRFRFNRSRIHVIFEDSKDHKTHFFTTPGLFIKYFQGKKSLKKNKALKYLMARFLRKILLVLNLESVGIITKGVLVHLEKLLTALFRPLSHPFLNPFTGSTINESDTNQTPKSSRGNIGISSVTFLAPKPFSYQKIRKRGRIKRKIQRRLVRLNKVID